MKLPKVSFRLLFSTLLVAILFLRLVVFVQPALAQSSWVYDDPEVTALGKASERARQLLFWYFNRPSLDNSPAILEMWAVARNIALILLVIIVLAFGFQLILTKERAKFEAFIPRLIGLLVFAFFSYVIVLGLIQVGDTSMKFFIERIIGKNLFNITFIAQNSEESYMKFVGARRTEPEFMESARAAFTLIKLTNFTYYAIFTILVLRKIILWFLLIVSPFLSLLFAFPFIRNVGWIWIGVFFQWLFYGPLFSIFLAGLVKIWEVGIPWGFDFTKVDVVDSDPKKTGVVFPTAINILYGGPAQKLTPTNTCNYVDTFAEYVIALIMLWAVMLLPWLLLRIFRDYCCEVIKSLEAATINLYGKLGGLPPSPPSMPGPAKMELPFRKTIDSTISTLVQSAQQASMAKMKTDEILNTVGLKVSSLADISRLEMNSEERKMALQKLEYLQSPSKVSNTALRSQFSTSNQELASRAAKGDVVAERTLAAASRVSTTMMASLMQRQKEAVSERETLLTRGIITKKGVVTPRGRVVEKEVAGVAVPRVRVVEKEVTGEIAGKGVVSGVPVRGRKITQVVPAAAPAPIRTVSVEDYEQVKKMWINNYRFGEVPLSEKIHSREDWLTSEIARISDAIEMISSKDEQKRAAGFENVAAVMPFLFLGGFTEDQVKIYLEAKLAAAKSQIEMEQVKEEVEKVKEEELVEIVRGEKEEKKAAQLEESLEMGEGDKKEKKESLGEEEEGQKKEKPEALGPEETGKKKDQESAEPSSETTEENLEKNPEDLFSKEDKQKV
jgi:hypothetical protein